MALHITDENFDQLLGQGKPMMVDFWATWCGPCNRIAPDIESLATQYDGSVVVGKCDVDENFELASKFGYRIIPTVLLILGFEVVDKLVCAAPKAIFEEKLKNLLQ